MSLLQKSILIIEDERLLNKAYVDELSRHGYKVLSAMTGEDGLSIAQKEKPDLIILDLMLPNIPGEKVLRILKEKEATKSIPVLVLSNKADAASINNCLDSLAAEDYLVKVNISMETLEDIVAKILKKSKKLIRDNS